MMSRRSAAVGRAGWALLALGVLGWLHSDKDGVSAQGDSRATKVRSITFNALDYRQTVYDFASGRLRGSRLIDADFREYPGNLLFDGDSLTVLEPYDRSGIGIDLGKSAAADSEFSTFYGLRQFKRHLQKNKFPYPEDFGPFAGVDRDLFFGRPVTGFQRLPIRLGHTYALRLMHRTRLHDERVILLRVTDYTPGVRVTLQWRDVPNEGAG